MTTNLGNVRQALRPIPGTLVCAAVTSKVTLLAFIGAQLNTQCKYVQLQVVAGTAIFYTTDGSAPTGAAGFTNNGATEILLNAGEASNLQMIAAQGDSPIVTVCQFGHGAGSAPSLAAAPVQPKVISA